jgi:hypothetical protein
MTDFGSETSTMTSRHPRVVFCPSLGQYRTLKYCKELTSKMWIGRASKNSCAMITVNSSSAEEGSVSISRC